MPPPLGTPSTQGGLAVHKRLLLQPLGWGRAQMGNALPIALLNQHPRASTHPPGFLWPQDTSRDLGALRRLRAGTGTGLEHKGLRPHCRFQVRHCCI